MSDLQPGDLGPPPPAEEGVVHQLKTWPSFFTDVISGHKSFEIRKNDRDFKVGERIILREWLPELQRYTGRWTCQRIVYMIEGPPFLPPKTCVLGIETSVLGKPFVPSEAEVRAAHEAP